MVWIPVLQLKDGNDIETDCFVAEFTLSVARGPAMTLSPPELPLQLTGGQSYDGGSAVRAGVGVGRLLQLPY